MMAKEKIVSQDMRELICEVAQVTASAYAEFAGERINYFRAMEMLLQNYKKLQAMAANEDEVTAIEFHEHSKSFVRMAAGAGDPTKRHEDAVEELLRERSIHFQRAKARFEEIDRVVRLFRDRKEFAVIRMYYFGEDANGKERGGSETYTWEEIAAELAAAGVLRDVKTARRWRNRIVNDMAVCLFGRLAAVSVGSYRAKRY